METHGAAAEEGAGDHGDEGHLGAAGDEGGGHDGHTAVTLIFDGTGGHDAGDTAAHADEHGDEGLTGQAELAEDTVQNEGDTGHIAAGLQESQHQEQHQHLGNKAQNGADTGHDTVKDQAAEPVSRTGGLQRIADQNRDTGDPHAVVGGIGLVKAVLIEVSRSVHVGDANGGVLIGALRDGVVVGGHGIDGQSLLVLHVHGSGGVAVGGEGIHLSQNGISIEVFRLGVDLNAQKGLHSLHRGGVLVAGIVIGAWSRCPAGASRRRTGRRWPNR